MKIIDTKLPITGDSNDIKAKGIILINYLDEISKYADALQYMADACDDTLSFIRDKSLIEADRNSEYSKKSVEVKKSYAKANIKVKVEIKPPFEDDLLKEIKGSYTYDEFKLICSKALYKAKRAQSKIMELKRSIDFCMRYPINL